MARRACRKLPSRSSRSAGAKPTAAPSQSRLSARRATAATTSKSRNRSPHALWGSLSAGRLASQRAFRTRSGSDKTSSRVPGPPVRYATASSPTWRVVSPRPATASVNRSQSARLARANGTRYFIAAWATSSPRSTLCWTDSGRALTRPSRRLTQLTLRSNRRDNSSSDRANLTCNSCNQSPCSNALWSAPVRISRPSKRASASPMSQQAACSVSHPSRFIALTRL